jgi:hypothetical protein
LKAKEARLPAGPLLLLGALASAVTHMEKDLIICISDSTPALDAAEWQENQDNDEHESYSS